MDTLRSSFIERLGRGLVSTFVPGLRELPLEEVASEPEYTNNFRTAALAYFMVGGGIVLMVVGRLLPATLFISLDRSNPALFWSGVILTLGGTTLFITSIVSLRVAIRVRLRAESEAKNLRASDPTFRDVERIRQERTSFEAGLFQRNLEDDFNLKMFDWSGVSVFEDGFYRFAPRVNVLLGKNGYGKTLLFRSLVAMLQRDAEYSGLIFPEAAKASAASKEGARLKVEVTRNGNTEFIIRDTTYFNDPKGRTVGKIPLLAIPDSRFLNRTRRMISGAASTSEPIVSSGAKNYLSQEPFENVVQDLLTQLCLDYREPARTGAGQGFNRQIFRMVEEVVTELTEDQGFRFAEIRRVGPNVELLVRTSGSQDVAIPIQAASQGTLSVLAIFALIYYFLHALRPELSEDLVSNAPAIVLIDEIDAHLHPSWQQKILGMLTRRFPGVQFIVSAHSPMIVAGCDRGEVSVLRRNPSSGRYGVETLNEDFLGASTKDLYERVFDIEEIDRLYKQYTVKGSQDTEERDREILRLEQKKRLSKSEKEQLNQLYRDRRLSARAEEVREQRLKSTRDETRSMMLDAELQNLRLALDEKDSEIAKLKAAAGEQSGRGEHAS